MAATNHAQAVKTDTKDYLASALLELLKKQKLTEVTVSQICNRAGVSRMAFYRNFEGLDDVLYQYFLAKISPVFKTVRESSSFSEKYSAQFELFEKVGPEMVASVERGYEPVIRRIFVSEIKQFYNNSRDEYWLEFVSSGVYAIWQKWLLNGRAKPMSEIMIFLKQIDTLPGVGVEQ